MAPDPGRPVRSVVFSGGGARGAYEAGVLRFVFEDLQHSVGPIADPEIALGTSVGAIHACYLAATADRAGDRWSRLRDRWLDLDLEKFLRIDALVRWRGRSWSERIGSPKALRASWGFGSTCQRGPSGSAC